MPMLSASPWPAAEQPTTQGGGTEAESDDDFFAFGRACSDSARRSERKGRCIRHATLRATSPVLLLTVAMIETALRTALMATVGTSPLFATSWDATFRTAISLTTITGPTDDENRVACAAHSLPENNLVLLRHPVCQVGLDKDDSSWQGRSIRFLI
jgi:hypothetical protein